MNGASNRVTIRLRERLVRLAEAVRTQLPGQILQVVRAFEQGTTETTSRALHYEARAANLRLTGNALTVWQRPAESARYGFPCYRLTEPSDPTITQCPLSGQAQQMAGGDQGQSRVGCLLECYEAGFQCSYDNLTAISECGAVAADAGIGTIIAAENVGRCFKPEVPATTVQTSTVAGGSPGLLSEMAKEAGFDYVENAVGGNDGRHVHVSVTPDICLVDIDLIFVLDASDSISDANWAKTKEFVKRVVSFFDIDSPDTASRVGAIAFSTYMNLDDAFNMSQYTTEEELGCAIEAIGRNPAYTYPGKALEYVRTHMLTTEAGMRPASANIPRVVVVISDGAPSDCTSNQGCPHEPDNHRFPGAPHTTGGNNGIDDFQRQARLLKRSQDVGGLGALLFMIGIRPDNRNAYDNVRAEVAMLQQLRQASSQPHEEFVFSATSIDCVPQIANAMTDRFCSLVTPIPCCTPMTPPVLIMPGEYKYFSPNTCDLTEAMLTIRADSTTSVPFEMYVSTIHALPSQLDNEGSVSSLNGNPVELQLDSPGDDVIIGIRALGTGATAASISLEISLDYSGFATITLEAMPATFSPNARIGFMTIAEATDGSFDRASIDDLNAAAPALNGVSLIRAVRRSGDFRIIDLYATASIRVVDSSGVQANGGTLVLTARDGCIVLTEGIAIQVSTLGVIPTSPPPQTRTIPRIDVITQATTAAVPTPPPVTVSTATITTTTTTTATTVTTVNETVLAAINDPSDGDEDDSDLLWLLLLLLLLLCCCCIPLLYKRRSGKQSLELPEEPSTGLVNNPLFSNAPALPPRNDGEPYTPPVPVSQPSTLGVVVVGGGSP